MANYTRQSLALDYNPPPPVEEPKPPRKMSVTATLIAATVMLIWPIVLGVFAGLAVWIWTGEASWIRVCFVGGIVVGMLASAGTVTGSWVVTHVLARPAVPGPAQTVINYTPLSDHQDTRIVPLRTYDRTVDKVNIRDLAWFVAGLRERGHSMRAWLGAKSPTGQIVDPQYWQALCKPLRKAGIIVGVEKRKSGRLVTCDVDVILSRLGLDPMDSDLWRRGPDQ